VINQDIPYFRYQRRRVVGAPWLFVFGETGRVDGDLVLDDGNIVTARQVLEGVGPVPLTKAARQIVKWVKTCAPKWVASLREDDYYGSRSSQDEIDGEECSCRQCRRERRALVEHVADWATNGCYCTRCYEARTNQFLGGNP
jgi:hypothetical protein